MKSETMTHKDLSNLLGVSETTVKSYRRKFPDCIPVANNGKPIRFTSEAAAVCLRIRDLFGTGMSVPEIRARLSDEFAWIKKDEKPRKIKSEKQTAANEAESGRIVSILSGLAKNMVSLNQQQNAILKNLAAINARLDLNGQEGFPASRATEERAAEGAKIEEALKRIEEISGQLGGIGGKLCLALEETGAMQRNWAAGAIAMEQSFERRLEQKENLAEREPEFAPNAPAAGNVVYMDEFRKAENSFYQAAAPADNSSVNPPRQLSNLPLVVRSKDGSYMSAGGSRGKLSVNDLKAILSQAFPPPNDYRMRWQESRQGWLLHIEQAHLSPEQAEERPARDFSLLLVEQISQRGISALDIVQLRENGTLRHPAEICAFINEI